MRTKRSKSSIQTVAYGLVTLSIVAIAAYQYIPRSAPIQKSEVQTSSNSTCLDFESYDWEGAYCYAKCTNAASCQALDERYAHADAVRPAFDKRRYFGFDLPYTPSAGSMKGPSDSALYTAYTVKDGVLADMKYGSSTPELRAHDEHTWSMIAPLIPRTVVKKVTEFTGYDDTAGDTSAFAEPVDLLLHRWNINVNDELFSPKETLYNRGNGIHTFVHEIGHIMTLHDIMEDVEDCPTFTLMRGCVLPDTIIAQYAFTFWPSVSITGGDAPGAYNSDDFVSSYAASNLIEDIAESWTAFVLLDKPFGNTIADQKVLFFYQYPEYVAAREQILAHLGHIH